VKVDGLQVSRIDGKLNEDSIKNTEALMKIFFLFIYQSVMTYEVARLNDGH